MDEKKKILQSIGGRLQGVLQNMDDAYFLHMEEIRIRAGQPFMIRMKGKEYVVSPKGELMDSAAGGFIPTLSDIQKILEVLSRYSFYAFEEEVKEGFLTIEGGHRIGLAGKIVLENGKIKTMKNIHALNIRLSHEIKGCADGVLNYIVRNGRLHHTMIISPPGCGKTTLLRDIVRQISNGKPGVCSGYTVGVVDERGEIAGCYQGIVQNDVGMRTDVLDCCPKAQGMLMLLRSMAPQVIAVDEIGKKEDFEAIESILNAGIQLICTVHGNSLEDIKKRPILNTLLEEGVFGTIIVLSGKRSIGEITEVYDENLNNIFTKKKGIVC